MAMVHPPAQRWLRAGCAAAVICYFLSLAIQDIWVADIWWQLRTGEWIVQNRAFPSHDTLSYTVPDHPWIELRWLYCVAVYLGWQAGGSALLVICQTAVLAAAFTLLVWPVRRTAMALAGILTMSLGISAASSRFVVRPEIVTFLLIVVYLVVLDAYRAGRARRAIWLLPLLQILWTNAHTLFVFGPFLTWLFAGGTTLDMLRRKSPLDPRARRRLVAVAVLVTGACWLNPYGHQGVMFTRLLFDETRPGGILSRQVEEFKPTLDMTEWGWDIRAAAILAGLSAASLVLNWRRTDLVRLLLWTVFLFLALRAMRNVALFGLIATWASLRNLQDAGDVRPAVGRPRLAACAYGVMSLLLMTASWFVITDRYYDAYDLPRRFGLGIVDLNTPSRATDFMLDAGCRPQVFHAMRDGAYLTWAAHEHFPVYFDGRLEVYGEEFIEDYLKVALKDWRTFADQWSIETVLLHRKDLAPLMKDIAAAGGWVLVHVDPREFVFVRDTPEHAELIRRYAIDPRLPWTPRGAEPDERVRGWRRWIGGVSRPWYSKGMAEVFLSLGSIDNAATYLVRALEIAPRDRTVRAALAQIRRVQGRAHDADALLAGIELSIDETVRAESLLADLLIMSGRHAEAVEPLRRAISIRPNDSAMLKKLGGLYVQLGDRASAVKVYREVLRSNPNDIHARAAIERLRHTPQ